MNKLTDILHRIDELQAEIEGHGQLDAELKKNIDYKFRLDWNYFSNAMEGNSLTRNQTKQLMMDNVTIDGKPFKDIYEMRGHDNEVLEILRVGRGEVRLSETRIKEMHKTIMHEDDPEKKHEIGKWKSRNNKITNFRNEDFEFLPYEEVPKAMHDLLNKTNAEIDALENEKKNGKHPVQIASEFHLEYIRIHPFFDGNGRTARLITNLLLISFGYPPFLLSEKTRKSYYRILAEIQGYGGDKKDFHLFLGDLLIESQELVLDAIAGKDISGDDDVDKEIVLFKQELSNSSVDLKVKDDFLVAGVIKLSIRPLLDLFVEKHKQFEDLFAESNVTTYIDNHFEDSKSLEFIDEWVKQVELKDGSVMENILGRTPNTQRLSNIKNVNRVSLRIDFRGFNKNGTNIFNDYSEIKIVFDEFKYSLADDKGNFDSTHEKIYSQAYSEREMMNIVNQITKAFLEKLKKRVQ